MEGKIDPQRLQLLNDRINETIDALNQVRWSVQQSVQQQGLSHTGAMGSNFGGGNVNMPYGAQQQFGQQAGMVNPQFAGQGGQQGALFGQAAQYGAGNPAAMGGIYGGISHSAQIPYGQPQYGQGTQGGGYGQGTQTGQQGGQYGQVPVQGQHQLGQHGHQSGHVGQHQLPQGGQLGGLYAQQGRPDVNTQFGGFQHSGMQTQSGAYGAQQGLTPYEQACASGQFGMGQQCAQPAQGSSFGR